MLQKYSYVRSGVIAIQAGSKVHDWFRPSTGIELSPPVFSSFKGVVVSLSSAWGSFASVAADPVLFSNHSFLHSWQRENHFDRNRYPSWIIDKNDLIICSIPQGDVICLILQKQMQGCATCLLHQGSVVFSLLRGHAISLIRFLSKIVYHKSLNRSRVLGRMRLCRQLRTLLVCVVLRQTMPDISDSFPSFSGSTGISCSGPMCVIGSFIIGPRTQYAKINSNKQKENNQQRTSLYFLSEKTLIYQELFCIPIGSLKKDWYLDPRSMLLSETLSLFCIPICSLKKEWYLDPASVDRTRIAERPWRSLSSLWSTSRQ